jgi:hypothetical protein
MKPLFTKVKVSPDAPPDKVKPGVPVPVEYKYTPGSTLTVISEIPAIYPPIAATFNEAFGVLTENVDEMETRYCLP